MVFFFGYKNAKICFFEAKMVLSEVLYQTEFQLVTNGFSRLQNNNKEPIFYGDLVYKFKRIVGKPNFSDQFKMIVKR